jgi:arabinoxylan arabinofuranohydrolase
MRSRKFFILMLFTVSTVYSQKQILPDFHADPSAHVWDGKIWIYPSHDIAGSEYWDMVDWHSFSSADLVNWTDHGVIFSLKVIPWAKKWAWAPDCMKRNDKYYFYFPAEDQIGVAVSDKPEGPFKDALGKPLIEKDESGTRVIDPAIFIDDDEQAYLYFGQNSLRVVKLNENMVTRKGEIIKLEVENFHEGIWVHKIDSLYYLTYASYKGDKVANLLEYSIGKSPYGPFEYKGVIMDNRSRNIHHSIVKFMDQWYIFYHVQGPSPYERRVCMEKLYYNPDGTIIPVIITRNQAGPARQ